MKVTFLDSTFGFRAARHSGYGEGRSPGYGEGRSPVDTLLAEIPTEEEGVVSPETSVFLRDGVVSPETPVLLEDSEDEDLEEEDQVEQPLLQEQEAGPSAVGVMGTLYTLCVVTCFMLVGPGLMIVNKEILSTVSLPCSLTSPPLAVHPPLKHRAEFPPK